MEHDFWLNKWQANEIGFHDDAFHPMLLAHWHALALARSATVFVPLCGKSKDMLWLRERGHSVIGAELSEIAVRAFFSENAIAATEDRCGPFRRFRGERITLLCGDFFALDAAHTGSFDAVYDRAALIALPPPMRRAYVDRLHALAHAGTSTLLVTVDYPPADVSPPPFLVRDDEVRQLYGSWCDVSVLGGGDTRVKGVAGRETAFRHVAREPAT